MKRVLMLICMVLPLWLSSCAQDDKGQEIEQTASESHEIEQTTSESQEIEQTINEGYGNYFLVPGGKFSMGDNYDEGSYDGGNPRERPVHTVYLDAYYIGEFEITNSRFAQILTSFEN